MTTFAEWDELDRRGKPKPSYINARVALNRMGLRIICYRVMGQDSAAAHTLWALRDSETQTWQRISAFHLRDEVIRVFGFDPGKKPLLDAVEALEVEEQRKWRRSWEAMKRALDASPDERAHLQREIERHLQCFYSFKDADEQYPHWQPGASKALATAV
ncbi:TPA: hypothetical protein ACGJ44_001692 [Pseudomonas aeruginosa]|uniref:hypothetical protein n=1 Tax=Pseudomonas aeruginosa TaxID=287 RepID=UPI00053D906E|nr:hypothetical protein [Pseudomonas aeruginosa]